MDRPNHGEYRLARQVYGKLHFAFVKVGVQAGEAGAPPDAVWALKPEAEGADIPRFEDDEVNAALDGIRDAFHHLSEVGRDPTGVVVGVLELGISLVDDVSPPAIRAASTGATLDAFGVLDSFSLEFEPAWKFRRRPAEES